MNVHLRTEEKNMNARDWICEQRRFTVTPEHLIEVRVLADLAAEELIGTSQLCEGILYRPEQCLVSHSDESRAVYFIVEGRVKIVSYADSEREVLFREMSAGEMIGELSAISGKPRSVGVWTVEETKVARLSVDNFWHLVSTNPTVTREILRHLAGLVHALTERVFEHDSLRVRSRVHAALLRFSRAAVEENNCAVIEPAPTQSDLGKLLGTNRHTVNKELRKLEKAGIIQLSRRRITVTDVKALKALLNEGRQTGRYSEAEHSGWSEANRPNIAPPNTRGSRSNAPVKTDFVGGAMALWNQALRERGERSA